MDPASFQRAGAVPLDALVPRAPSAGGGAAVFDVTEANFAQDVLQRSEQVPVVLDFWATWCAPCRTLSPVLERLAIEADGAWVLAKVDCDAQPGLAEAAAVQGIPAVKAVLSGRVVGEFTGALPEPQLREWLAQLVEAARDGKFGELNDPPPGGEAGPDVDPELLAGEDALVAGELDVASEAFGRVRDRPGVSQELLGQAKAGLARAGLLRRAILLDPAVLQQRLQETPDDLGAVLSLADALVVNDRAEEAFAALLDLIRRSTGEARDSARRHLLDLFDLLGDADPLVSRARRDLAGALF